jgi:hypothetical protein
MHGRIKIAIFLLSGLCCSAGSGVASEVDSVATISDQDLAAVVTGTSIAIALHTELQSGQSGTGNIAGNQFQNFSGIQTISANTGQGAIGQAATSLAMRATLAMGAAAGSGF